MSIAKSIKEFEQELNIFKHTAVPYAMRSTLNGGAFTTQKVARAELPKKMILRNKWTHGSIQVETAKGINTRNMMSKVGSVEKYMADQEFGGTKIKKGKEGLPIATRSASNEGRGNSPRKKRPMPSNRMNKIRLMSKRAKGKTKKQKNIIAIKQAKKSGRKHVFLDLGKPKSKGIYKIMGGKRKPKIEMIHSISKTSVDIPKNPWLAPSVNKVRPAMSLMYFKALQFQIQRFNLF